MFAVIIIKKLETSCETPALMKYKIYAKWKPYAVTFLLPQKLQLLKP